MKQDTIIWAYQRVLVALCNLDATLKKYDAEAVDRAQVQALINEFSAVVHSHQAFSKATLANGTTHE